MQSGTKHKIRDYGRRLVRDRRRLTVSFLLLSLSFYLVPHRFPDPLPMIPTEAIVFIWVVLSMPLVAIHRPRLRYWLEVIALADLIFCLTGLPFPIALLSFHASTQTLILSLGVYSSLVGLIYVLIYGSWSDRFLPHLDATVSAKTLTKLDLPVLWYGMVPTPGYANRLPEPDVVAVEYADPSHKSVRLITWTPEQQAGEVLITFDHMKQFSYVMMQLRIVEGMQDPIIEGTSEFWMEDNGYYRSFRIRQKITGIPLRRMLRGWLDDTIGRMIDARLAGIECRASKAKKPQNKGHPLLDYVSEGVITDRNKGRENTGTRSTGYRTAYDRTLSAAEQAALRDLPGQDFSRSTKLTV
ncbi:MAG: hypothetical protein P8X50_13775 [Maritimibacter sp.]